MEKPKFAFYFDHYGLVFPVCVNHEMRESSDFHFNSTVYFDDTVSGEEYSLFGSDGYSVYYKDTVISIICGYVKTDRKQKIEIPPFYKHHEVYKVVPGEGVDAMLVVSRRESPKIELLARATINPEKLGEWMADRVNNHIETL